MRPARGCWARDVCRGARVSLPPGRVPVCLRTRTACRRAHPVRCHRRAACTLIRRRVLGGGATRQHPRFVTAAAGARSAGEKARVGLAAGERAGGPRPAETGPRSSSHNKTTTAQEGGRAQAAMAPRGRRTGPPHARRPPSCGRRECWRSADAASRRPSRRPATTQLRETPRARRHPRRRPVATHAQGQRASQITLTAGRARQHQLLPPSPRLCVVQTPPQRAAPACCRPRATAQLRGERRCRSPTARAAAANKTQRERGAGSPC